MNGYERIVTLLEGVKPDHLPYMPITMMYAGDQLGIPYGEYVRDAVKLVDAQIMTAKKLGADHVSAISDPCREAADFGAVCVFHENQPPAINELNALLTDRAKLEMLRDLDPRLPGSRTEDRVRAVELFRQKVKGEYFIEGWVEGPCAEGADLRGITQLMMDFIEVPEFVHRLFDKCTTNALMFAKSQIDAGADIIGVGDAAASLVGPRIYQEFVFPYEQRLVSGIQGYGGRVRLHICGNISKSLDMVGLLHCDMVDIDFMVSMAAAREKMGPEQILTGNIDPVRVLRNGTPEEIQSALAECAQAAGPNYIVGAGCEVPRDTSEYNLTAMREFAVNHKL